MSSLVSRTEPARPLAPSSEPTPRPASSATRERVLASLLHCPSARTSRANGIGAVSKS